MLTIILYRVKINKNIKYRAERYIMYDEIKRKLKVLGISKHSLAVELDISYNPLLLKLNGKSKFTLDEAIKIHSITKSTESVEELFGF